MLIRAQTVIYVITWFVERRQDWHLCAKYFHPSCALTCSCNVWVLVKWEFLLYKKQFYANCAYRGSKPATYCDILSGLYFIKQSICQFYLLFIFIALFSVFKDLKKEQKAYSAFMLVNHFSSTFWSYSYLKIFMWGKKKKLQALCFFERNDHFVRINYMFFHDFWNVFSFHDVLVSLTLWVTLNCWIFSEIFEILTQFNFTPKSDQTSTNSFNSSFNSPSFFILSFRKEVRF